MEYSNLIPQTIASKGDYFYFYCGKCECERKHWIVLRSYNTIRHTVRFSAMCYDCWDNVFSFNIANFHLNIEEDKELPWIDYIYSIHHWNEFVINSLVPEKELPPFYPIEEKKGKPKG